jgi:hypothetical protein
MNWIFEDPLIRNRVFSHRIYLHTEKPMKLCWYQVVQRDSRQSEI